jgi:hypothetical protein
VSQSLLLILWLVLKRKPQTPNATIADLTGDGKRLQKLKKLCLWENPFFLASLIALSILGKKKATTKNRQTVRILRQYRGMTPLYSLVDPASRSTRPALSPIAEAGFIFLP